MSIVIEIFVNFFSALIYLLIIIDPFASLPIFATLTRKMTDSEMRFCANQAVFIAGALALLFIFAGTQILSLIQVDLQSFKIGGGIILGLLGLETVFGFSFSNNAKNKNNAIITLIATPLLTGPGLITSLIVMTNEQGYVIPLTATISALYISLLILENSARISKKLGSGTINIITRVFGLFLVALGVSYIRAGIIAT
ncbi:MAG: MarC family protein [Candidatus Micrarchaeota archaeon]